MSQDEYKWDDNPDPMGDIDRLINKMRPGHTWHKVSVDNLIETQRQVDAVVVMFRKRIRHAFIGGMVFASALWFVMWYFWGGCL